MAGNARCQGESHATICGEEALVRFHRLTDAYTFPWENVCPPFGAKLGPGCSGRVYVHPSVFWSHNLRCSDLQLPVLVSSGSGLSFNVLKEGKLEDGTQFAMAAEGNLRFSGWDYAVFSVMFGVSIAIGLYYACTGGKQRTTKEYLMADRSMSVLPVSLSLLASFMSAITVLGTPAEVYTNGTMYWMFAVTYVIVIVLTAHLFLPTFYRLGVTSTNEVHTGVQQELRSQGDTRNLRV
ncbi:Sodium-coupled monocarboxylate transporter 1 [Branchiostoma belcheri]|nr:Sodium-coupled monocarboxylate transporter 1 [Branchiostoma belcheri]